MNEVRKNPICVISIETFGDYAVHDIQTNSAWQSNPYEGYVVVPDDMVEDILATQGFCDITLSKDGTEVKSFKAREIPEIEQPAPKPSTEERLEALEAAMLEVLGVAENG